MVISDDLNQRLREAPNRTIRTLGYLNRNLWAHHLEAFYAQSQRVWLMFVLES